MEKGAVIYAYKEENKSNENYGFDRCDCYVVYQLPFGYR